MDQGPDALRITVTDDPPGIAVVGDVDVVSIKAFDWAVTTALESSSGSVHVDLGGVGFIDLEGLRVLLKASRTLAKGGRQLVIIGLAPHLREVLRIVGWSEAIAVEDDER